MAPEPIARGSRFTLSARGAGSSTVEIVEFIRPTAWAAGSIDGLLPMRIDGAVAPRGPGACQLTVRLEIRATGPLRLLEPVLALALRPTARGNISRIRRELESRPAT